MGKRSSDLLQVFNRRSKEGIRAIRPSGYLLGSAPHVPPSDLSLALPRPFITGIEAYEIDLPRASWLIVTVHGMQDLMMFLFKVAYKYETFPAEKTHTSL